MEKKTLKKMLVLGLGSACMMNGTVQADTANAINSDSIVQIANQEQACKGKNSCKGKGGCKTDTHACKGKNSCKGSGGCKSRPMLPNDMAQKRYSVI